MKLVRVTTVPMSLRFLLRGQLKFMRSQGIEVTAVSSPGKEVGSIKNYEGVSHMELDLTRQITPVRDIKAILRFWKFLKKQGIDVVHSHTPKAGLVAMFSAVLAGVKVRIHTVAGIPWMEKKGLQRAILKQVDRLVYRAASHIYANSFVLKEFMLRENLIDATKVSVIGNGSSNGIDLNFFNSGKVASSKNDLRKQYNIPEDAFVFVFVGRIVRDKGMNELATAFENFDSGCYLMLVGPLEQELNAIDASTLKFFENNERVILVGYQEDVRPFYKMSDALVFPSYREGFPNVPLQAGAMGLPCIVTNINGCNEIIEDGVNGVLIEPKNSNGLENAMKRFYKDRVFKEEISKNSRHLIAQKFDQMLIWESLFKDYNEFLNKTK